MFPISRACSYTLQKNSTLIGLSHHLQGVKAFGTNGEQALIDAFC